MRILYVAEGFPTFRYGAQGNVGGGGMISARIMATEVGRDHEVVVFTPSYGRPGSIEDAGRFRIFRYPNRFAPKGPLVQQKILFFIEMAKHLANYARAFKPDILHAQGAMSVPAVAEVARMHRIVGTAHVRSYQFECFTGHVSCLSHRDATLLDFARCVDNRFYALSFPYAKLVTKTVQRALARCGKVFAVSNYIKSELLHSLKIDARVSYPAVDLEMVGKIRPATQVQSRSFSLNRTIFYAGGLYKLKGIFELLGAFLQASRKLSNLLLLVAGDGPQRNAVHECIKANKLEDHVALLGPLPYDMTISVIKASDLVIVPSLWPEPASRVAIEALACGRPVIGSTRGAIPEVIGSAGIVLEPSAANIERAILTLLDDRANLKQLGLLARQRSEMFSATRICNKIVRVYEEWTRK